MVELHVSCSTNEQKRFSTCCFNLVVHIFNTIRFTLHKEFSLIIKNHKFKMHYLMKLLFSFFFEQEIIIFLIFDRIILTSLPFF